MPTVKDIKVHKPSNEDIQKCQDWPIWECETSEFEWEYTQTEKCLILEGLVTVTDISQTDQSVSFGPGDYIQFPVGLKCVWKVTKPVKKHYNFE